jgi:hypothetical protein
MPMIFSHIHGKLPRRNSEEIEIDPKASSVCMTFGCGVFFLVCAMIGYFYVKAFELHGLSLPGLLKVRSKKMIVLIIILKQSLILASFGFLLIGIGGRQKWKENLENIKSPKKRSSII